MNYLLINLLFFLFGVTHPAYHPIHVSICNLEFNESGNTVSIKLFKDDFALLLKNKSSVEILMEKADEKVNSQIISNYINSCLQIEVNKSKNMALEYKYSEINEDAIWLHFQIEKIKNTSTLKIKNTLMLELWEDQTNLLIINWMGKENGYRFDFNDTEKEIDLNT